MDIELSSFLSLILANCLIVLGISLFLCFFHKWTARPYDDLAMNIHGEFLGQGISNIESLLDKDESTV